MRKLLLHKCDLYLRNISEVNKHLQIKNKFSTQGLSEPYQEFLFKKYYEYRY
ncbi:hypothetical protein ACFL2C_02485 [Patescibacteria group bacterium]